MTKLTIHAHFTSYALSANTLSQNLLTAIHTSSSASQNGACPTPSNVTYTKFPRFALHHSSCFEATMCVSSVPWIARMGKDLGSEGGKVATDMSGVWSWVRRRVK